MIAQIFSINQILIVVWKDPLVLNSFCYAEASAIPKFRPKILPDDEIAEGIILLSSKYSKKFIRGPNIM